MSLNIYLLIDIVFLSFSPRRNMSMTMISRSSDQLDFDNNANSSSSKIASLRVKSGEDSYLVTMKYTDTIEMLKEHIKSIRL
jgi:hypothetical protein